MVGLRARIDVKQGSLVDGRETVLVNASNTAVWLGSGVSAAIREACGPGYPQAIEHARTSRFGEELPPGDVLITHAGSHPTARYVAHVAVMDFRAGTRDASPTLWRIKRGCRNLWSALEAASSPRERLSVAMVALGAGVGGLGVERPTAVACDTLAAHLAAHPDSVIAGVVFYGYTADEYDAIHGVVAARLAPARCSARPSRVRTRRSRLP